MSQSATTNFGGTIADGPTNELALVLAGPGTLVLSGTDAYSGGTMVEGGTLTIATASALPAGSSLTVGAGGTFIFDPSFTAAPAAVPLVAAPAIAAAAVPEPDTLALLAAAGFMAVFGAYQKSTVRAGRKPKQRGRKAGLSSRRYAARTCPGKFLYAPRRRTHKLPSMTRLSLRCRRRPLVPGSG